MRLIVYHLLLCGVLLLTACSVDQRVEEARAELMTTYTQLPDYQTLPVRQLSWGKALQMLEANNLELQHAQYSINQANEQLKKIYTDFIPIVDIGQYFNRALIKGKNSYASSAAFDVNIFFNIPAITQLPVNHYTRQLQVFKAEQDKELKRRELVARLWQYFRDTQITADDHAAEDAFPDAKESDQKQKLRERELQTRDKTLQLCALLNDYSARWQPVTSSLPRIHWNSYRKKTELPDPLTQTIMALTLEAARLQKLGIGLRYLPNIHVNFYSPSLFSSSGGTTSGFMSGDTDVRMNMNIYFQLDTRLEIWSEWLMAKENYRLVQEELTQKMFDHRNKMQLLLDSWKAYDDWKASTQDYINFRRSQGACTPTELRKLYNEDLQLQKEMLEQDKKNLERECALIQEYGLPQSNTP